MPQKAWSAKRERQYARFKVELELMEPQEYDYKATFNPTIPVAQPKHEYGWVSPYHFGINEGPS